MSTARKVWPPGGPNAVAKKNSPLQLVIQYGFSNRIVRKLVSLPTERPSSHRTASFSGELLLYVYVQRTQYPGDIRAKNKFSGRWISAKLFLRLHNNTERQAAFPEVAAP